MNLCYLKVQNSNTRIYYEAAGQSRRIRAEARTQNGHVPRDHEFVQVPTGLRIPQHHQLLAEATNCIFLRITTFLICSAWLGLASAFISCLAVIYKFSAN
ncbi:Hypothetical_protein [Hexamita inflata]|uniref:Hypothetical_protein n=1 Tax=Hexamita inflata TaxID=28002 RepID=A0AA86UGK5_9EUKA|nr:Hypothetical protein HINF_LOCUS42659 [Hexamita inflata]